MIRFLGILFFCTTAFSATILHGSAPAPVPIINTAEIDPLQTALRETEIRIAEMNVGLLHLQNDINAADQKLNESREKQALLQASLDDEKNALREQVRVMYALGEHVSLRLLLNQEDIATIERSFAYLQALNQARLRTLAQMQKTMDALQKNQREFYEQENNSKKLYANLQAARNHLLAKQTERSSIVSHVDNQFTQTPAVLHMFNDNNKKQLSHIVETIQPQALSPQESVGNFSANKGHLPWPVQGKIIQHYGDLLAHSFMGSNGILISAPEGTPIHAIFPGKVVFADWLQGYGMLLIIDHGNGFMSLYAHDQVFYKVQGQKVLANELVARVGDTGGLKESALYFEIRRQGKPENPAKWLA